jgi:hypothetical protein
MSVEVPKRYTVQGVKRTGLAVLFLAGSAILYFVAGSTAHMIVWLAIGVAASGWGLLYGTTRKVAEQLADTHRTAVGLEDSSLLFDTFRPSQAQVDAELCGRALLMERACTALAEFNLANRHMYAHTSTSTEGKRLILMPGGEPVNRPLEQQLSTLEQNIQAAKSFFWDLHSRLWRVYRDKVRMDYDLLNTWQAYAALATGDDERSKQVQQLLREAEQGVEGANEQPGQ